MTQDDPFLSPFIIRFKTAPRWGKTHALQLAAYKHATAEWQKEKNMYEDTTAHTALQTAYERIRLFFSQPGARQAMGNSGACQYKTADDAKCAVGSLIPDNVYYEGLEGAGLSGVMNETRQMLDLPFSYKNHRVSKNAVGHAQALEAVFGTSIESKDDIDAAEQTPLFYFLMAAQSAHDTIASGTTSESELYGDDGHRREYGNEAAAGIFIQRLDKLAQIFRLDRSKAIRLCEANYPKAKYADTTGVEYDNFDPDDTPF